jgi:hypothetical protein
MVLEQYAQRGVHVPLLEMINFATEITASEQNMNVENNCSVG